MYYTEDETSKKGKWKSESGHTRRERLSKEMAHSLSEQGHKYEPLEPFSAGVKTREASSIP